MHKQTETEIKIRIVADIRKTVCINAFVSMENKHLRSNSQRKKKREIEIEREEINAFARALIYFHSNQAIRHTFHIIISVYVERF